jgi:hypothetical protein
LNKKEYDPNRGLTRLVKNPEKDDSVLKKKYRDKLLADEPKKGCVEFNEIMNIIITSLFHLCLYDRCICNSGDESSGDEDSGLGAVSANRGRKSVKGA